MSARAGTLDQREEAGRTVFFFMAAGAVMLFTTFTAAVLIRRTAQDWVRFDLPPALWLSTLLIALSSGALEVARRSFEKPRRWVAAGIALGVLFIACQVWAWSRLAAAGEFRPDNPRSAFLFVLTGIHLLHLLAGMAVLAGAAAGRVRFEIGAAWWHVVGGIWGYLFLLLNFM